MSGSSSAVGFKGVTLVTQAGGAANWVDLNDTPGSITALEFVRGNAGGTALEFVALSAVDHGGLGGLADNDHPQYPLKAGAEAITGAWDFQTGVRITSSHPQLQIEGTAPRLEFRDTTPTNGDNWYFQGVNNNFRIRNASNSDGELRIEEKLDLNRNYDPSTAGTALGFISIDPTFSYQIQTTENYIDFNPTVTINGNLNAVVLRGGGNWEFQGGATTALWTMFRANPTLTTSNSGQVVPSPTFYDCRPFITIEGGTGNNQGTSKYTGFSDQGSFDVIDGATLDWLDITSFTARVLDANSSSTGIIQATDLHGFKFEFAMEFANVDTIYGFRALSLGTDQPDAYSVHTGNGICSFGGAINHTNVVTAAATLSITRAHHSIIGSLAGNQTFTLPDCTVADTFGRKYNIKKTGASGTLTVDTTSSQTIDGALTATLTIQYESITLMTDGVEWFVL